MTQPSLSIQLVQWGKTDLTVRSIASLKRSVYDGPMEILVYDNASPGGPGPVADDKDVVFVAGEDNIGFGPAHNILAERAQGDLIIILNNDTILEPHALSRLADRMMAPDRPGAVTPMYRDFDGSVLEMGGYLGVSGSGWQLWRGMNPPSVFTRMSYPAHYGSGACLMVRRRDFLDLGGFDDMFAPAYYEDTDLCLKLEQRGGATMVEPTAVVFHYEGATSGRDLSSGPKAFQMRNRTRFVHRWSSRLDQLPPIDLTAAIAAATRPDPGGIRVLVVAPQLPKPDRDAGSARLLAMVGALRERGHSVHLWAEHASDAGRYAPLIEKAGAFWSGRAPHRRWAPTPGEPESLTTLESVLQTVPFDLVVIAWPSMAERFAPDIRRLAPDAPIVVDAVDLHFLREERAAGAGAASNRSMERAREVAVYEQADGVITASPVESDVLADLLPGQMIHSYVSVSGVTPAPGPEIHAATRLVFLGGLAHPPNLDAIEYWVDRLADPVAERLGRRVSLSIVGSGTELLPPEWLEKAADRVDVVGWLPELDGIFAETRVFFAPLRYGAGTKGKILTALYHGVPIVTTPMGAEGHESFVESALVVSDDDEGLIDALVTLFEDDDRWRERCEMTLEAMVALERHQQALDGIFVDWIERRAARR